MKIADLDLETRRVIVWAKIVAYRPSEEHLRRLRAAIAQYMDAEPARVERYEKESETAQD